MKRDRLRAERRVAEGHEGAAALRAHFETRLNSLERAFPEMQDALVTAMRATSDIFDQMGNNELSNAQRADYPNSEIEIARIGKVLAELREQRVADNFRFARERGDAALLPPKLDL